MALCKILMADDDPEDRLILQESIGEISPNTQLNFAPNGEEALAALEQDHAQDALPSLIVLDLNMPLMNGTETLAAIKMDPRFQSIPVVIYSTSINSLEKEKCLHLGAQAYWVKPVSYQESKNIARHFLKLCGEEA